MNALYRRLLKLLGAKGATRNPSGFGTVAAIVAFDREDVSQASIGEAEELEITTRLHTALERAGHGQFDGADRSASSVKWFFFGERVDDLEATLIDALRAEPSCRQAVLRVSASGIAGPWRETRL